ncbi:LysR family transcriptional regulator [Planktotalea sp.]|uniref:LysR family transcriptional regulator n=1 Tax=Planktotalea sp. TaxID=2029877 RepID=UPI003299703A
MRNLDLTALRSFVAIAETGGVTRAAGLLNLTQSAVSMQIKRLEESLDLKLLERSGRQVVLSPSGEQLLTYARQMVGLNDEIIAKLTDTGVAGEISLGVPHDIVYPVVSKVLQQFRSQFPNVVVNLRASFTRELQEGLSRGEFDIILTTEEGLMPQGETLSRARLSWTGAEGGTVWRQRPLKLGFSRHCMFRPLVQKVLDKEGIGWEMATETDSDRTIEATIGADLAICVAIEGTEPPHLVPIQHGGTLPDMPDSLINMYGAEQAQTPAVSALAELLRQGYSDLKAGTRLGATVSNLREVS